MNIFAGLNSSDTAFILLYLLLFTLLGIFIGWLIWNNRLKRKLLEEQRKHQKEVKELKEQQSKMESEMSMYRADNKRMVLENEVTETRNTELLRQNEEVNQLVLGMKNNETGLKAEVEDLLEKLGNYKVDNENFRLRLNKLNIEHSDADIRIENLEAQIRELKALNDELQVKYQNDLATLNTQLLASQNSVDEYRNRIAFLSNDNALIIVEEERDTYQTKLKESEKVLHDLTVSSEERIATLEETLNTLQIAHDNTKDELASVIEERTTLDTELVALKDNLETLEGNATNDVLAVTIEDENELEAKIERLEKEKVIQEETIQFLKEDYDKLKAAYEDEPELAITEMQLKQLKVRAERLTEERDVALEEVESLKQEMEQLKTGLEEDPEMAITQLQLTQLKTRVETLIRDREEHEEEIEGLKKEMTSLKEEVDANADLAVENNALKEKVNQLTTSTGSDTQLSSTLDDDTIIDSTESDTEVVITSPVFEGFPTEEDTTQATKYVKENVGILIPKASEEDKDDLTQIDGVGRFLEKQLNSLGIYTYEQVSSWDNAMIEQITYAIGYFPGRIAKDNWVEQAKALVVKA